MQLSEYDKSRVRAHLGYFSPFAIPVQYSSHLENAVNDVRDELHYEQMIRPQLDLLDALWLAKDPTNPESFTLLEQYAGDINRAKLTRDPDDIQKTWMRIYIREGNNLATMLGKTVNLWDPENQDIFIMDRSFTYNQFIPGPAIPNAGSNLFLFQYMA